MLYKHLFSILCGHLNLNQKRKKIEFDRLPVKPAKPTGKPVRTDWTCDFEFDFEFDWFLPVSGQIGPVNHYRTAPVWSDRSVYLTLCTRDSGREADALTAPGRMRWWSRAPAFQIGNVHWDTAGARARSYSSLEERGTLASGRRVGRAVHVTRLRLDIKS